MLNSQDSNAMHIMLVVIGIVVVITFFSNTGTDFQFPTSDATGLATEIVPTQEEITKTQNTTDTNESTLPVP